MKAFKSFSVFLILLLSYDKLMACTEETMFGLKFGQKIDTANLEVFDTIGDDIKLHHYRGEWEDKMNTQLIIGASPTDNALYLILAKIKGEKSSLVELQTRIRDEIDKNNLNMRWHSQGYFIKGSSESFIVELDMSVARVNAQSVYELSAMCRNKRYLKQAKKELKQIKINRAKNDAWHFSAAINMAMNFVDTKPSSVLSKAALNDDPLDSVGLPLAYNFTLYASTKADWLNLGLSYHKNSESSEIAWGQRNVSMSLAGASVLFGSLNYNNRAGGVYLRYDLGYSEVNASFTRITDSFYESFSDYYGDTYQSGSIRESGLGSFISLGFGTSMKATAQSKRASSYASIGLDYMRIDLPSGVFQSAGMSFNVIF
ncbi:MAG: hypothetical protein OEZ58_20070 [Gammaproteobacteria bacterium]|nr:hypothetical protein [Gammaproteobacteria bacterium]MDH5731288.1 hypothetical protein [Gammaproteobacteria bacterium]